MHHWRFVITKAAKVINDKKKLYSQMKIIHQVNHFHNATNLWKSYLSKYEKYIDCKGCEFNMRLCYSEARMIRDLNNI